MLYCFDKDLPWDFAKIEMIITKVLGNGILYDHNQKKFTNLYGEEIDITGKVILPRTGVRQVYDMNEQIEKHGGISLLSKASIVEAWPNYYETLRKIEIIKGKDILTEENINRIEGEYGKEFFFKTKDKNFHGIISIDLLKDKDCVFYNALKNHLEDEFIISEKVDILEDQYGLKEYRCFVLNDEIYNISRMTTEIFHQIDADVLVRLNEIRNSIEGVFPSCYCVDLIEYEKDGEKYIDVCEFNDINAAGPYLYNSILENSTDLLHKDIRRISTEFIDNISKCRMDGTVINGMGENLYNVPNSFSSDLRSLRMSGSVGIGFTSYTLDEEDYSKHLDEAPFHPSNLEPITSEDDFDIQKDDDDLILEVIEEIESEEADLVREEIKARKDAVNRLIKSRKAR